MTDTLQEMPPPTPPEPKGGRRRDTLRLVVGLAAAVVVTAVAIGIVISRDDRPSSTSALADRQLGSMRQACQQWIVSSESSVGRASDGTACAAMTDWMGRQLRRGHMTGTMMWGNATTMRATCRQWMATGSAVTASGTDSPAWCGDMVTWMTQHIGNWDEWVTDGHMMGG